MTRRWHGTQAEDPPHRSLASPARSRRGRASSAAGLLYNGEDADAVAKIACPIANDGRQSALYKCGRGRSSTVERRVDMTLTLTLAAGLFAAPLPQAEPPKGWIILDGGGDGELKGHEYPKQAEPPKGKGWVIELGGYKYHKQAEPPKRKELIIEFQWREAKPQIDPVEVQYSDDLPAFFKQFKVQMQVQAVEAFYVDDLPTYFKQLKKR
jgi:hypothetical protein